MVTKAEMGDWRRIVAAVAVFLGMMWVLGVAGGWSLPVVLVGIITVVAGHEFGHYWVAKRAGMTVTDFFVGFGPVAWSTTRGGTRYGVRMFPIGGYVKVPGMTWEDHSVAPENEAGTYRAATATRKVLFASAGIVMNMVMAVLLLWSALVAVGWPAQDHVGVGAVYNLSTSAGTTVSPAAKVGLVVGTRIVTIDGQHVTSNAMLIGAIQRHANQTVTLGVTDASGKMRNVKVTPVDGRQVSVNGQVLDHGTKPVGVLGVGLVEQRATLNWLAAVPRSITLATSTVGAAAVGIFHVFSPGQFVSLAKQIFNPSSVSATVRNNRPESIVGIVRTTVQGSSEGGGVVLLILAGVNIFVGLFNLIPILPLDGGYVAIAVYERARSRKGVRHQIEMRKLMPVIYAFVGVLILLFSSTLYLDLVHPLANPFH